MVKINKTEDIYVEIDKLIKMLAPKNEQRFSDIIEHRVYKVSWTSRSELFEELQTILMDFLHKKSTDLDALIVDQIERILSVIEREI